jgi:hypothetical protein
MIRVISWFAPLLVSSIAACDADPYASGAGEPIQVREGTFRPGALPIDPDADSPLVINAGGVGAIVTQGQASLPYSGLASKDAFSIGVAFPGIGTGYWVVPVGGPDVTQDSNLLFGLTIDFTVEVPHGLQTLQFVALDGRGRPGPVYETTVCVLPETAYGSLAACDPATPPQSAVLSLSWDTQVDLDLIVIAPNGKLVSSKLPTTALVDAGTPVPSEVLADPTTGRLSRDSNAGCHIDGIRLESLVFPGEPPAGEYQVYASLAAACGQPSVLFDLALLERIDAADGTFPVERTALAGGQLLALHANGSTLGTYLTTVILP